jgi:hypothetical protein
MTRRDLKNRTNVRFSLLALATVSAGCAAQLPLAGQATRADQRCAPHSMLICERYGPDRSCECAPRSEIATTLADFGSAAWPGGEP